MQKNDGKEEENKRLIKNSVKKFKIYYLIFYYSFLISDLDPVLDLREVSDLGEVSDVTVSFAVVDDDDNDDGCAVSFAVVDDDDDDGDEGEVSFAFWEK